MRGTVGMLVGLLVMTVGLAGLGYALSLMMTHADPDAALKAVAGLATFVVATFISLAVIR